MDKPSDNPRKRRITRRVRFLLGVNLLILGVVVAGWLASVSYCGAAYDEESEIVQITVLRPRSAMLLRGATGVSVVGLFLLGLWIAFHQKLLVCLVTLSLVVGVLPSCLFSSAVYIVFEGSLIWTTHGKVTAPDKQEYCFMDFSLLQGQTMVIAKVGERGLLTRTMEVLGANNGDSPRSWASVVRPRGALDEYGQLYLTESNWLVGIRYGNHCYLAYDRNTGAFYGHGDIEELSPFILIGPDTEMHQPDVDALLGDAPPEYAGQAGAPRRKTLLEGRDHPNPAVRELAVRILEIYKQAEEKVKKNSGN